MSPKVTLLKQNHGPKPITIEKMWAEFPEPRDLHSVTFEMVIVRLDQDILVVDDYKYIGIDFFQDLDLALPEDEDWDAALGKKHVMSFEIVVFVF